MAAHAAAKEAVWSHHNPARAAAMVPGEHCKTPASPRLMDQWFAAFAGNSQLEVWRDC